MSNDARFRHPETPFPVGVEYYRGPVPRQDAWDGDFARIKASGFHIVRSFSMWNHMEPRQGRYELEDFDLLFDLAEKHGLSVWMDVALATHGACPEWLTRRHPDINVVNHRGERLLGDASAATPQGSQAHCYDHPAWRRYGGDLLRHVVERYKDRPNLLLWGLWDGVAPPRAPDSLCYCDYTIIRYKDWLRGRFTLDTLNEYALRRYRTWDDVEPPRSSHNVVESLLFKQFHYENLADHLRWMVGEARTIDPDHEVRAHAAWNPRPWDETCAPYVDSWGMSMPSNDLLTSNDPYKIADRAFAFDWSRSVGSNGRWWNEEIYAGMHRGGVTWKKQSDPRELTTLLWMTLVGGAAGTMFWQYRPEYLSFESPGYNLVALDGEPTARFEAVTRAVAQIESMSDHLPLECPRAEVAVVYHPESQELFGLDGENERYLADLRGAYRTLWTHGIPADIVTPKMDWSGYRLILMPNLALMTEEARSRIEKTLANQPETRIVAEGSFGMYQSNGASSYRPPEGFAGTLGARVADLSRVTTLDIAQGHNVLQTSHGNVILDSECGYAVLEPTGDSKAVATLDGQPVGVRTADGRLTWLGLTLSAGFGDVASPPLTLGLAADAEVSTPVAVEGDIVVPVVRGSRKGGQIIFAFNIEPTEANTTLKPQWPVTTATDLLTGTPISLIDGAIHLTIPPWELAVIYCE